MKVQEEIKKVMSYLFEENWREKLLQKIEPAKNINFGEFKEYQRLQKLSLALTYISESIRDEAWKIGKALSFQAKKEKFGDTAVIYGEWNTLGPKEDYVPNDSGEPGIFKAVRKGNQWQYFFRDDKWSPWEEYVLPLEMKGEWKW